MAQAATSGSAEEEMAAHARTIANLLEDNDTELRNSAMGIFACLPLMARKHVATALVDVHNAKLREEASKTAVAIEEAARANDAADKTQGDLLMMAKARRQSRRSQSLPLPGQSPGGSSNLPQHSAPAAGNTDAAVANVTTHETSSTNLEGLKQPQSSSTDRTATAAAVTLPPAPVSDPPTPPSPPAPPPPPPPREDSSSFFGGLAFFFQPTEEPSDSRSTFLNSAWNRPQTRNEEEAKAAGVLRELTPLNMRPIVKGRASALAFAGGHLDLVSACALACVDVSFHRVLSSWLHQLRSVHAHADEPVRRLRAAADAAAALPQIAEIFVSGRRLDVRWLRGAVPSAATRTVLDLSACLSGGATSAPKLQVAFAVPMMCCRIARDCSTLRRVVPWGAAEVDLFARKLDYGARALGEVGVSAIAGVLSGAHLPYLRELTLTSNKIGDGSVAMLAAAIANGALAGVKLLGLGSNRIGPVGAASLASGAMGIDVAPRITHSARTFSAEAAMALEVAEAAMAAEAAEVAAVAAEAAAEAASSLSPRSLPDSVGSHSIPLGSRSSSPKALSSPPEPPNPIQPSPPFSLHPRPLRSLATLNLEGNLLGDAGVEALAAPVAIGALPALEVLVLSRNGVTDLSPLTLAIASGEVPALRRLLVQNNRLADGALRDMQSDLGSVTIKRGNEREAATPAGVRVSRTFAPSEGAKYVPSTRRGFPQRRDQAVQTREVNL